MKFLIVVCLMALSAASTFAGPLISGGFMVPAAAKIQFFSPGNGIDHTLKVAIDALIIKAKDQRLVLEHTETGFGIEGEVTVCILLNDFFAAKEFNQQLIDLVGQSQRKTKLEFVSTCVDIKTRNNDPFVKK